MPDIGLLEAIDAGLLPCKPYPMQRTILGHVARAIRSTLCIGRRSGKSRGIAAPTLVWRAALCPSLRRHVQAGELIWHISIAASQEQARIVLAEVRRLLRASPTLAGLIERDVDNAVYLTNGSVLSALVCNARTVRGLAVATAHLDEFAFFTSTEDGPQAAQAVYRAITPGLAQFGADRKLIVSSTPNGTEGYFKTVFDQTLAAADSDDVYLAHLATWDVNPAIPQDVYDQERQALGEELFLGEYAAQFLGSGNALLSEADITACIRPGGDYAPDEIEDAVLGLDLGYRRDPSAAVIVGRVKATGALTVAALREWEAPKDLTDGTWQHQRGIYRAVAALADEYDNAEILTDSYEAQTTRAQLGRLGAFVRTFSAGEVKYDTHRELARHIRSALITFPDDPRLISDLRRLRVVYGGAKPRIENPRMGGRHGDAGQALAICMQVFVGDETHPSVAMVAHPGRGWSDGRKPTGSGQTAGFIPGRIGAEYASPGAPAWLGGFNNYNYD